MKESERERERKRKNEKRQTEKERDRKTEPNHWTGRKELSKEKTKVLRKVK
jgi:hypothetical protein